FDADAFAFQILDRFDARRADDHVAALAVIEQRDEFAFGPARAADERIGRNDANAVHFSGRERVDRRQIFEPDEIDIEAGFLEPAFLFCDLEDRVARPVGVADFYFFRAKAPSRHEA